MEALGAVYLKSDSSKFHHLLGFTNVPAVNEDEFRPHADEDEVLGDVEDHKEKLLEQAQKKEEGEKKWETLQQNFQCPRHTSYLSQPSQPLVV